MGYNRRALYLKKAAEQGKFISDEHSLTKLPGVGKYTARAILVFAFRKDIAMVDTNIRQIITHFFFDDNKQKESVIQDVADQLVPKGKSWEWHQALMDYGAIALIPRVKKKGSSKKTIPFKYSNRFFRGKLIDRLREGSVREKVLRKEYPVHTIEGLITDGLIVRNHGTLSLPS